MKFTASADISPELRAALDDLESIVAAVPDALDAFRDLVKGGQEALVRTDSRSTATGVTFTLYPTNRLLAFLAAHRTGEVK